MSCVVERVTAILDRLLTRMCLMVICQAEQKPTGNPLVVRDMPHMAQFVFDFYQHKLRQLAAQQTVSCCHRNMIDSSHIYCSLLTFLLTYESLFSMRG